MNVIDGILVLFSDLSESKMTSWFLTLINANKNGTSWNYPEESEIRQTKKKQDKS